MAKDKISLIKKTTTEFLEKLLIAAEIKVEEADGAVLVNIETADPGILIGRHGRNLEAIQILLGQMIYQTLGEWTRIVVSVGDYRERRAKQLQELALNVAQKVTETKEPMVISDLTPAERRIIHLILQDHESVKSESEGEGKLRKLVIKPRV